MLLCMDVAFRNFGWTVWDKSCLLACGVISTEPCRDRNMYVFAQKAADCGNVYREIDKIVTVLDVDAILCDLPTGSQSAKAAKLNAYAIGVIACVCTVHELPIDYVTPQKVKKSACGVANATKEQMMERACQLAAIEKSPGTRTTLYTYAGVTLPAGRFEHVADSICLYHAAAGTNLVKMFG